MRFYVNNADHNYPATDCADGAVALSQEIGGEVLLGTSLSRRDQEIARLDIFLAERQAGLIDWTPYPETC